MSRLSVTILFIVVVVGILIIGGLFLFKPKSPISAALGGPITHQPASFSLNLTSPDDNLLVFNKDLAISGNTSPNLTILIYSDTTDMALQSKDDGSFSADLNLDPGVNNIKVIVFDKTGDQRSIDRTIYYSKTPI